jgi:WD40 repeat protein
MSRTVKHAHPLLTCSLSEKTNLLATAGTGMKVFVYRLGSMRLEHVLLGHCDNIVCCKFSPDGTVLASSSQDTKIFLWDALTGQLRITLCSIYPMSKFSLAGNHSTMYSKDIEFDCFGSSIISVSPNMKIRLWEASHFPSSTACEEYSVFPGQLLDDEGSETAACALDRTNSLLALCSSHKLQVFRVRPRLPRLAHLCRSAIRRSNYLAFLDQLPPSMQRYIAYLPEWESNETLNSRLVCNILAQAERELSQRQVV